MEQMPNLDDQLSQLFSFIGGMQGVSKLAVVTIVVQMLVIAINTRFFSARLEKLGGKFKISLVYGLSILGGVLALKTQGLSLIDCLLHANTLAAYQVFGHQFLKQFMEKRTLAEE